MKVTVSVTGSFKKYTGGKVSMELELENSITAADAVKLAGVPQEEIGFVIVNGTKVDKSYTLSDGDIIKAYPLIIGG